MQITTYIHLSSLYRKGVSSQVLPRRGTCANKRTSLWAPKTVGGHVAVTRVLPIAKASLPSQSRRLSFLPLVVVKRVVVTSGAAKHASH